MTIPRVISERTLLAATERGVLTPDQAERLRALEVELAPVAAPPAQALPDDDERLRFITGFGDIFVTIGLALFLGALSYFAERQFETTGVVGDHGGGEPGCWPSSSPAASAWRCRASCC